MREALATPKILAFNLKALVMRFDFANIWFNFAKVYMITISFTSK